MFDICNWCQKRIEYGNCEWWEGYKKPENIDEALNIMKSKAQEIILCKNCQKKLFESIKIVKADK